MIIHRIFSVLVSMLFCGLATASDEVFKNPNFMPIAFTFPLNECPPELSIDLSIQPADCDRRLERAKYDCIVHLIKDQKELLPDKELIKYSAHFSMCVFTEIAGCKYNKDVFSIIIDKEINNSEKDRNLTKEEEKRFDQFVDSSCPNVNRKILGLENANN
ncbi:MAG: hypothetical protein RPU39_06350 [Candidatus Sedimenticola sp. (ex Thyasira tokunagai)]